MPSSGTGMPSSGGAAATKGSEAKSGCPQGEKMPSTNMNTPDATLGQYIGRQAGIALAGQAPMTVSSQEVTRLGNALPEGARVSACADQITFSKMAVSLVIEAAPSNNPDMTFRVAGLINPTVTVPQGATVQIEFINADTDEAHALVITSAAPPYALRVPAIPAFAGSAATPIGDPTTSGQGAADISFVAGTAGTYYYLCPMPGHAEMGMVGQFIVQ
jgi:rusticyanin